MKTPKNRAAPRPVAVEYSSGAGADTLDHMPDHELPDISFYADDHQPDTGLDIPSPTPETGTVTEPETVQDGPLKGLAIKVLNAIIKFPDSATEPVYVGKLAELVGNRIDAARIDKITHAINKATSGAIDRKSLKRKIKWHIEDNSRIKPADELATRRDELDKAGGSGTSDKPEIIETDYSEDSMALGFISAHPEYRWIDGRGKWFRWDARIWVPDNTLSLYGKVREFVRHVACTDEKRAKTLKKANTIAAVERLSRCDQRAAATIDQWDCDPWLLNTDGGIVDLKTGKLEKHDPLKYMTRKVNAKPSEGCHRWASFLDEVTDGDKDLQRFLQRVVGYSITGSVREHALFFFFGTGRNGKGVFLNVLVSMLGEYAGVAPMEALTETHTDRHPTELAALHGKRFVTAQEVDEGGRWAESKLKTLTGGDPITARYMRQDFFTFEPQFKLLIAGNHKPAFKVIDEAIKSRLHLIPFTVTIPKEKRDPDLQKKLKSESPGILQWAIDGCLEYQRIGLAPPEAVTKATKEYFQDEDVFQQWIDDRCKIDPNAWETPGILFGSWKAFAEAGRFKVGTQKSLSQRLQNAGFNAGKSSARGGRYYDGIKAIQEENQADHYGNY